MTVPAADHVDRREVRELAATFAQRHVVDHIPAWEKAGEIPRELHLEASRAGLLGLGFAEEVGGGGTHLDLMAALETMIRTGVSVGVLSSLMSHVIALPGITRYGSDHLKQTYAVPTIAGELVGALAVTEPSGGSDVAALRTRAVRDGEHYVVNGSKMFITSGVRADYVTTAVRTGEPGHRGISLLVIDKDSPGFTVSRKLDKMGWLSSDTAELSFDDVRVPVENLVGPTENAGFRQIMEQFESERLTMAVECTATAERCLALTIDWVKSRDTFGAPLSTRQVVRHRIADMARRIDVARTYVWDVAERWHRGEDVSTQLSMAKNTAVLTGEHVVHEAVQLHGGMGFMRESEVEMHYRDMRVQGIGGGTNEIMNEVIAKQLGL